MSSGTYLLNKISHSLHSHDTLLFKIIPPCSTKALLLWCLSVPTSLRTTIVPCKKSSRKVQGKGTERSEESSEENSVPAQALSLLHFMSRFSEQAQFIGLRQCRYAKQQLLPATFHL
jgi:hypothetical protein